MALNNIKDNYHGKKPQRHVWGFFIQICKG